jgi:hypothetical protein
MRAALLLLLTLPAAAAAQVGDSTGTAPMHSPVIATRLSSPVHVDGRLDEPVWTNDHAVTAFTQREPHEGAAPSQRTEVRLAYDDDALYVGARCFDDHPESLLVRLSRRDVEVAADRFAVYLDPFLDRRSGYYFLVSAAGTLLDGTLSNDVSDDDAWDGVWEARTRVDERGWTVEMRIPYSQLRFPSGDRQAWGVNFGRVVQRHNEESYVVYRPRSGSGFVSRFPELLGIESIRPPRSIELLPYLTSKAEYLTKRPLDPFHDGSRVESNTGGDLRMGVGGRLTLNATVNPDFGQVEVDPAIVNLSDVESFFHEKRPFFVEGSSVFNFGNQGADDYPGFDWPEPKFFYSRRIGRSPQGDYGEYVYADAPVGTSILGAAKLIGKITPTINFGTLHAIADREFARLGDGSGGRWRTEIEPRTYYGVARGLKEFAGRRHGLGLMTTAAVRDFDDANLRDQLNGRSLMTGFDGWTFLDREQVWVVSGWSAMSHVAGSAARMTELQRGSRHYFQRPDAGHVEVDSGATSLTGFGARTWLHKQKGNVQLDVGLGFMDPKFDVADVGFHTQSDLVNGHVAGGYKWTETTRWRREMLLLGSVFATYDFGGNSTWRGVWVLHETEFTNNWELEWSAIVNPASVNNRKTRGGPLMRNQPGHEGSVSFRTDDRSKLSWSLEGFAWKSPAAGSFSWSVEPAIEWKPAANVTIEVGPEYSREVDGAFFVDSFDDPAATATYGRRYAFARLDQREAAANLRLDWAFSPRASLQTYVQALISTGAYTGFKSLARPGAYEFEPLAYGENPDFNFKSLRGNAVFRWEARPGSTLFLVWTQQREREDEGVGDFRLSRDFRGLTAAPADDIFLAKLTWYFTL